MSFVVVGAVAGVMPGLFGFGGGWLLVPLAVMCLGMRWAYASGTVLCAILAGATSGVVALFLRGRGEATHWDAPAERSVVAVMVVAALVGTVLGKTAIRDRVAHLASASIVLDGVLTAVLAVIAARLAYEIAVKHERAAPVSPGPWVLAAVGGLTLVPGVLSGLTGIGGGILYVPIVLFLLRWREDDARTVSRVACMASAMVGTALYGWSGGVKFAEAAWMFVPAGLVGVATSGVRFSHSRRATTAYRALAAALALVALALTVVHMWLGSSPVKPTAAGGAGLAGLAVGVPLAWGVVCALGERIVRGRRTRAQEGEDNGD